jgi:hypothetical protein
MKKGMEAWKPAVGLSDGVKGYMSRMEREVNNGPFMEGHVCHTKQFVFHLWVIEYFNWID